MPEATAAAFEGWVRAGLGHALEGRPVASLDAYQHALALQPQALVALLGVAQALIDLSAHALAISFLDQALALQPDLAPAWFNKSLCLQHLKQSSAALRAWDHAVDLQPDNADAWLLRGITLSDIGDDEEALRSYARALALRPEHAETWSQQGLLLSRRRCWSEALDSFRQAAGLRVPLPGDWLNLGVALNDLGRHEEAIGCFSEAQTLDPGYADAWCNQGISLTRLQRLDEAQACFDRAMALQPDLHVAAFNRASVHLLAGRWEAGWEDYEFRWRSVLEKAAKHRELPRLESVAQARGRRVIVWAEQGLGDTLQFFRFAPLLREAGAEVLLEADASLLSLLARAWPGPLAASIDAPADFQIPLLSLPRLFACTPDRVPASPSELQPEPARLQAWRDRVGRVPGRWNIAIACSGNPQHANDHRRSCALQEFVPLLAHARLFVLQKRLSEADLQVARTQPDMVLLGDETQDFHDTAAALMSMDLVISVDTALVHLAGALGRETWVLLPHAPDWRWMLERHDTPWYPRTTLFRQIRPGDWSGVFVELNRRLRDYAGPSGWER